MLSHESAAALIAGLVFAGAWTAAVKSLFVR
jgi:hypothetical protein